jgi:hypothetical protein
LEEFEIRSYESALALIKTVKSSSSNFGGPSDGRLIRSRAAYRMKIKINAVRP